MGELTRSPGVPQVLTKDEKRKREEKLRNPDTHLNEPVTPFDR